MSWAVENLMSAGGTHLGELVTFCMPQQRLRCQAVQGGSDALPQGCSRRPACGRRPSGLPAALRLHGCHLALLGELQVHLARTGFLRVLTDKPQDRPVSTSAVCFGSLLQSNGP